MHYKKITFIGSGNMARAIVLGMLEDNYPTAMLTMTNRSAKKLDYYSERGIQVTQDNGAAVKDADVVVLTVKPYQIQEACRELVGKLKKDVLIISVAAGITTEFITQCLSGEYAVVRAMPNTALAVSAGVTGVFANDYVTATQEELVEEIFAAISLIVWLEDETLIPVVTAVSGSGIAYYFRFMELMECEAVNMGLPAEVVKVMVAQTALGAAKLALELDDDFKKLCENVTSPNGTTERALAVMDENNLGVTVQNVMRAAFNRSKEITEELCKL